jgi:GntR family transcriptional repressor for pyruvate dehydrogenase complex
MRALLDDIVSGKLAPGGEPLREADIVERFGVSRGVARECVRGLEERGLVSVKPGRGATVSPQDRWAVFDPDVVSALLGAGRDLEILGDYLECRRILDVEAVALAAERATDEDLAALAARLSRMEAIAQRAAVNPAAEDLYRRAEVAFHGALVAAAHNGALAAMLAPLLRAVAAVRRPAERPDPPFERSVSAHRAILEAIAARDGDRARAAMREHLAALERDLSAHANAPLDRPGDDEHRAA